MVPKQRVTPKTETLPTPQAGRSLSPPSGCLGFLTPAASGPVWPKGQASLSIPAILKIKHFFNFMSKLEFK